MEKAIFDAVCLVTRHTKSSSDGAAAAEHILSTSLPCVLDSLAGENFAALSPIQCALPSACRLKLSAAFKCHLTAFPRSVTTSSSPLGP